MDQRFRKRLTILGAAAALAVAAVPAAQASHGADDPVGHDVGDDNGGLVVNTERRGADDPANHDARDDSKARKTRQARHHKHHRHHRHAEPRDDRGSR
jgi:hypothetical protein